MHSCPKALVPHVEWALAREVGKVVKLDWEPQPLMPTMMRTVAHWRGAAGTAAEVIGLSGGTIGERLYTAKVYFQTPDLFAWTAVIVLISALFEKLFLFAVDRLAERVGA